MQLLKKLGYTFGACIMLLTCNVQGAPEVGKAAPDFTLTDTNGKAVNLADLKGKIVVLEWSNFGCPFVKKHYESKNMQDLQSKYRDTVTWITVFSSAEGKQGFMKTDEEANTTAKEHDMESSHIILDPKGDLGKAYEAKTTPHMFVIDKSGIIAYMGAIDDDTSADSSKAKGAKNYVATAIDALVAGQKIEVAATQPYGCSVKYAG